MNNFDFLKDTPQFKTLYGYCNAAEQFQMADPEKSALNARKALEWIVKVIYFLNKYNASERASLYDLVTDEQFKDFLGADSYDLQKKLHFIRKAGNLAAHEGGVTRREAFFCVLNLHAFVAAVLKKVGLIEGEVPQFDKNLIPRQPGRVMTIEQREIEPETKQLENLPEVETLGEVKVSSKDMSEAETRRLLIDMMLREAGWQLSDVRGGIMPSTACIEVEVEGMAGGGKGYADYVLFGADGRPLAVIEAKRTTKSATEGKHQAELYAEALERRYGVKPVIYYTNGYRTYVEDGLYPPREVYAYHTSEELRLMIQRRSRRDITDITVNSDISGRDYQIRAVHAVCEHFNKKFRRALLVMATGTGKTRTAISLVDVLTRNSWVKNTLFLADRTALVKQAHANFAKLLPDMTYCVLSDDGKSGDLGARITLSTYQTMINYIDAEEKEFPIGRFDLIIVDEAHRSVFGKYGSIFEYFDSLMIGLTATPREDVDRSTYEIFQVDEGEPNFAYELDEAVSDGYLVPYEAFKKGSDVLNRGIHYSDLSPEERRQLEKVWTYEAALNNTSPEPRDIENREIFKYIYNKNTVDKVLQDLMEHGLRVDGGETLGKTIIFASNHRHAELIVERFGVLYPELQSAGFCQLIDNYVNFAQDIIDRFSVRGGMPQIAVSVDMLDVGIDVPDVLNLVFFKVVKSKIKFWQMIGRGTRLSPHIFGEGEDKKCFYIFDWCGNFDFFSLKENGKEAMPGPSLTEKLFGLKTDIAVLLQKEEYQKDAFARALHDGLKAELCEMVCKLQDNRIKVRQNWEDVDRYRKPEAWTCLTAVDAQTLKDKVAPLLVNSLADANVKRFDCLVLLIELSLLDETVNSVNAQKNVAIILRALQERASIPQVQNKMPVINEMLTSQFWDNLSLNSLERLRTEIRELIRFLEGKQGRTFTINVEDAVQDGGKVEASFTPMTYKERVIDYLKRNKNLPVLEKIRHMEQLSREDIDELERILWQELGSKEEYERYVKQKLCGDNVGVFIRSVIGIDRKDALRLFSDFIQGGMLNSRQEEYLKSIISYVCENGDISADTIINQRPFADYDWTSAFGTNAIAVGKYVNKLHGLVYA